MPRPSPITTEQELELIALYTKGESRNSLADKFNASRRFVSDCLRRHGIQKRSHLDACFRLPVNHAAFDNALADPEAAYWVGFLMADGCISMQRWGSPHIILAISAEDEDHVRKFRSFLKAEHAIQPVPATKGRKINSGSAVRLDVASTQLAAALARYGVVPRKTYRTKVAELEFSPDFWRGVIDGDGSLHVATRSNPKYKPRPCLQVVGSFPLLSQFAAFAASVTGTSALPYKHKAIWGFALYCKHALKMIRLLYSNQPIALARKLAKANEIIARFAAD